MGRGIFKTVKFSLEKKINRHAITLKSNIKMAIKTTKFHNLTFSGNGLVLEDKNKQQIEISFAELDQIYMKKHKLHSFVKFIGISFPFLFVFMSIQYLPFNLMILVSIITVLPIFMFIINYKSYRLYVRLNDGTIFLKKIALNLKTENISILEKVRTEYLYYKASLLASA